MPAGGSRLPASHETVDQRMHFVHQEGQAVFKYASRKMYEVCRDLLARNSVSVDDIALLIPHQANLRIIRNAAERLGIPQEKVVINIERYGNTTAATIPLATARRHRRRPSEEGWSGALRRRGRRLHRRRQPVEMGVLALPWGGPLVRAGRPVPHSERR